MLKLAYLNSNGDYESIKSVFYSWDNKPYIGIDHENVLDN